MSFDSIVDEEHFGHTEGSVILNAETEVTSSFFTDEVEETLSLSRTGL
jgi:hypothetical protein